ncbi:hypothetical protein TI39_contig896g00001 [Zymoseptoria brevis]|uniref:Uncharacterized protein n=1 Tax=Zymoseptoria brevis TaxID=1047168 RepID=A0A0F4GIB2_9PEZI|nr:hypothetical protein TI39_contig896g00001 [Zymoseptoria brevis]
MPSSKNFDTQLAIRGIRIMAVLFAGQTIGAPLRLPSSTDAVDGGIQPILEGSSSLLPRDGPGHSCISNNPNHGCKAEAVLERSADVEAISSSIIPRNEPGHSCATNSPSGGCEDEAVLERSTDAEYVFEDTPSIVARSAPGHSCISNNPNHGCEEAEADS